MRAAACCVLSIPRLFWFISSCRQREPGEGALSKRLNDGNPVRLENFTGFNPVGLFARSNLRLGLKHLVCSFPKKIQKIQLEATWTVIIKMEQFPDFTCMSLNR